MTVLVYAQVKELYINCKIRNQSLTVCNTLTLYWNSFHLIYLLQQHLKICQISVLVLLAFSNPTRLSPVPTAELTFNLCKNYTDCSTNGEQTDLAKLFHK